MCTTFLVISTLVFLLRRHFFNKVEPYHERDYGLENESCLEHRRIKHPLSTCIALLLCTR
uniref:Uncharacterized protein n=1 Tax=Anolis carolinensis TaxID=28377 RepID=A0A803TQB8_ANOCA